MEAFECATADDCSMFHKYPIRIQTRIDVLKTSAGADMVGATKIFEKEIGEEEIVCRIPSFIMIRTHHWVR
jgi:hypothetical protein